MVCGKCKFEFCWMCLTSYKGYKHQNPQNYCPIRRFILSLFLMFLISMLNMKIVGQSETILAIEIILLRFLAVLFSVDSWILTLYFVEMRTINAITTSRRAYRSWDRTTKRKMKTGFLIVLLICEVAFRIFYAQAFVRSDDFALGMILLGIQTLIGGIFFIYKFSSRRLRNAIKRLLWLPFYFIRD